MAWVCWGAPGAKGDEVKAPWSPVTSHPASTVNPRHWGTYQQAYEFANRYGFKGIGFVLSSGDPYTLIDLDDPKGDPTIIAQQQLIFNNFPSYAEISPSGRGLHIIIKGDIHGKGRKRNCIEIYSKARYMTMTGNAYRNINIVSCQAELMKLYSSLGGDERACSILEEYHPEELSDEDVFVKAKTALNGEKFLNLWEGRWEQYYSTGDNGPSEADYALIDILAFYTKSKAQIVRMFHASALGQRAKAHRQDYIDWMLNKCFDKILPPVDLSYLQDATRTILAEARVTVENPDLPTPSPSPYTLPDGLVGEIADFLYNQAPRPVPEIALTGALALMSGVVGRAYNVSATGLNQYYLLLADTGTGKEAMAIGIGKLISATRYVYPGVKAIIGPGEIASSQGLVKYLCNESKSFLSIVGEFGIALKEMTERNASGSKIGLRRILLDLYNKSGKGQELGSIIYSEKEKNTKAVIAPNVTILGESTPERFYEVLSEEMISEGLLPRFLCIEYKGGRPKLNYGHSQVRPSEALVQRFGTLVGQCAGLNSRDVVIDMKFNNESNEILADFNDFCDDQINNADSEVSRHLWNRAHLKVMKLSSLVSIGLNPFDPIITGKSVEWAKAIVIRDCVNLINRFAAGEVGWKVDERQQMKKLIQYMVHWIKTPWPVLGKTTMHVPGGALYHSEKVVPYGYLQRKLTGVKSFREAPLGPTVAITKTIRTLIEMGEIEEMEPGDRKRKFGNTAKAYVLLNLKHLEESSPGEEVF